MDTNQESVHTVYKEGELMAIVKRDDKSKKHLVYMTREATSEEIISLIKKD